MKIEFKNVLPFPLADTTLDKNTLWSSTIKIEEHQTVLVQAVSGKGKSTFVNSIYGIRKDFTGEILLNGKSTKEISSSEWSQIRSQKLAIVFQDLQLIPHLSIAENLALKNELTHHTSTEQQKEWLNQVGLYDKWNTRCGTLSYGQQQRVAIIRSILQPFETLLLDEPFAHLDEKNTKICYSIIQEEVKKNKATLILTTLNESRLDHFTQQLTL